MAEDFRAKVTAELDTAEAESKLNAFLNEKRKLKIDVEVNQDSAKKMASSIEKGIKDTKIDTSGISKQLAGSFNITDKNVISKLQSQMDKMISSLGKTWNGKDFDFGKASGFYSGMDSMVNTVTKNAKIVEGATGSYDAFFNYFKDKKIYVSDELKKAMGGDTYKELLQNNIGKIVRDASKGISIDSLWGEMRDLFPEHFSDNITNQVDQIVHAFDVLHQARADVGQVTTAQNMTAEQLTGISDSAAEQVVAITMYRVMSDCFCENEFGSEDNEIHHIRKKNQYKPSEGKECNRAENLQLLPREIHKNLTYYASKPDAEHNKELEEKIKNADCPSFQFPQEQFQDLLMAALYDCNVSGGKAIMYTTTITDNVEDIEAEAHVLDVGKILKQNLEECE